jgi:DNA-binding NtrC family response regulator
MADILVVDDEIGIRELLSEILGDEGHTVLLAESAQQARELRAANALDLVLLDIWMPDTDGVTLLREWAGNGLLSMPVIMMSGHATIDTAVEATRIGAIDFLEKPVTLQKLLRSVAAGLAQARTGRAFATRADANLKPGARVDPALGASVSVPNAGLTAHGRPLPPGGISTVEAQAPYAESAFRAAGVAGGAVAADPGLAQRVMAMGASAEPLDPIEGALLREWDRAPVVSVQSLPLDAPLRDARDAFERVYFEYHLQREQGSMTRVAERTGLERTHLYRKLKQLGVDLSRGAWRKREL